MEAAQYPKAAERVGRVLAASRWTADYIVRHPIILDELVDGRIHEMDDFTPVDWSEWADENRSPKTGYISPSTN